MLIKDFNKKSFCFVVFCLIFAASFLSPKPARALSVVKNSDTKAGQEAEEKEANARRYLRDHFYEKGRDYYSKGKYEEASLEFKEALEYDSVYSPALKFLKLCEMKIERQQKFDEKKKKRQESIEDKKIILEQKISSIQEERIKKAGEPAMVRVTKAGARKVKAQNVTGVQAPLVAVPYRIGQEDALEISVWQHPNLSSEIVVPPDGMVSLPLVGDIKAGGLTIFELKKRISQGLSEFAKKRFVTDESSGKREYLIGVGDTLQIAVWRVEDLSLEVIVRPDGMISFPLIGDIKAAGLTLAQLDNNLTKALSDYVKDPQVSLIVKSFGAEDVFLEEKPEVSIAIKKFGNKKVVVLGDVTMPGVYSFTGEIRLSEAIAMAKGSTKYAHRDNILIIRGEVNKNPKIITANLIKLYKEGDLTQDVPIQHQDVVFVPKSVVGNIKDLLDIVKQGVDTAYAGRTLWDYEPTTTTTTTTVN